MRLDGSLFLHGLRRIIGGFHRWVPDGYDLVRRRRIKENLTVQQRLLSLRQVPLQQHRELSRSTSRNSATARQKGNRHEHVMT